MSTLRPNQAVRSAAATIVAAAFVVAALAGPSAAQTTGTPPDKAPETAPKETAPKAAPDLPPPRPRGEQGRSALPQQRPDGARALEKLPQTAEEKRRQLGDLYAKLATADSEEAAKPIAAQIERLWRHSGSDTVNVLISRAAKLAGEKRVALAGKLLNSAVSLAPDYTEAFSQRAFFHYSQGDLAAAAGDLRRVLALDSNHYKAMEGLVQIWRDSGNKRGAFEAARQLMDTHPFATGAKQAYEDLKREVEGRGI